MGDGMCDSGSRAVDADVPCIGSLESALALARRWRWRSPDMAADQTKKADHDLIVFPTRPPVNRSAPVATACGAGRGASCNSTKHQAFLRATFSTVNHAVLVKKLVSGETCTRSRQVRQGRMVPRASSAPWPARASMTVFTGHRRTWTVTPSRMSEFCVRGEPRRQSLRPRTNADHTDPVRETSDERRDKRKSAVCLSTARRSLHLFACASALGPICWPPRS